MSCCKEIKKKKKIQIYTWKEKLNKGGLADPLTNCDTCAIKKNKEELKQSESKAHQNPEESLAEIKKIKQSAFGSLSSGISQSSGKTQQ